MIIKTNRHTRILKTIALVVVCLFLVNTLAWAVEGTLSAEVGNKYVYTRMLDEMKAKLPEEQAAENRLNTQETLKVLQEENTARNILEMKDLEILGLIDPKYGELRKHSRAVTEYAEMMAKEMGLRDWSGDADKITLNKLRVICLAHDIGGILGDKNDEAIDKKLTMLAKKYGIECMGRDPMDIVREFEEKERDFSEEDRLTPEEKSFIPSLNYARYSLLKLEAKNISVPEDVKKVIASYTDYPDKIDFGSWTKEERLLFACFTIGDVFEKGNSIYKTTHWKGRPLEDPETTLGYIRDGKFKEYPAEEQKNILEALEKLISSDRFIKYTEYSRTPLILAMCSSAAWGFDSSKHLTREERISKMKEELFEDYGNSSAEDQEVLLEEVFADGEDAFFVPFRDKDGSRKVVRICVLQYSGAEINDLDGALKEGRIGAHVDVQKHRYQIFSEDHPEVKKAEKVLKGFILAGEFIRSQFGDKFKGTYWAAGYDAQPCKEMGGVWTLVGLDYENGSYNNRFGIRYDDPEKVKKAGYTPISWDVNNMALPEGMTGTQDAALIKTTGGPYEEIRKGLWYCATESLRDGGILVSDMKPPKEYQDIYIRLTDQEGVDEEGLKFVYNQQLTLRKLYLYRKKSSEYPQEAQRIRSGEMSAEEKTRSLVGFLHFYGHQEIVREMILEIGPSAVPVLIETLNSNKNPHVRSGVMNVLGKIRNAKAISHLIDCLGAYEYEIKETAAKILAMIGAPVVPLILEAIRKGEKDISSYGETTLEYIGKPAIPFLRKIMEGDDADFRRKFTRTYAEIEMPEAKAENARILIELLANPPVYRDPAGERLIEIGPTIVPLLCKTLLEKDRSQGLSHKIVGILVALKDTRAIETLGTVAKEHKDTYVRNSAIEALAEFDKDAERATPAISSGESILASIIILARKAKLEKRTLKIGLDISWIPGYEEGNLQHMAITELMRFLETIDKELKDRGIKDVVIVKGEGARLAGELLKEQSNTADLSNIVVLGANSTISAIESEWSTLLKNITKNKKPLLAGVDGTELKRFYKGHGEDFNNQLRIQIVKMLSIALEVAAGKDIDISNLPIEVEYIPELKKLIFFPKAEPIKFDDLKDYYKRELQAILSA